MRATAAIVLELREPGLSTFRLARILLGPLES